MTAQLWVLALCSLANDSENAPSFTNHMPARLNWSNKQRTLQHKRMTTGPVKPHASYQARGGACCALRTQITIKGLEGRVCDACFKNICSNERAFPSLLDKRVPEVYSHLTEVNR